MMRAFLLLVSVLYSYGLELKSPGIAAAPQVVPTKELHKVAAKPNCPVKKSCLKKKKPPTPTKDLPDPSAPTSVGKLVGKVFPCFMGGTARWTKLKFWLATLVGMVSYMMYGLQQPLMLFPVLLTAVSFTGMGFVKMKAPRPANTEYGIEEVYTLMQQGDAKKGGWYPRAPYMYYTNMLLYPEDAGVIISQKHTRLHRGVFIVLPGREGEPIAEFPESMKGSVFHKHHMNGNRIGVVLREATTTKPPLVRAIDPWELARDQQNHFRGWSVKLLQKLHTYERAQHDDRHKNSASDANKEKQPYNWRRGAGIMLFPFIFAWFTVLAIVSFKASLYDALCYPGSICQTLIAGKMELVTLGWIPDDWSSAVGLLGTFASGTTVEVLTKHYGIDVLLWSFICILVVTATFENIGLDRRDHEQTISERFGQLAIQDKKIKQVKLQRDYVYGQVDVMTVNKQVLGKHKLPELDVWHENAAKKHLYSEEKGVRPLSPEGWDRILFHEEGKTLFPIWPHGYVVATIIHCLHFARTADTAKINLLVADVLKWAPGANVFLWLKNFGFAGRPSYQYLLSQKGNKGIFPGGFKEAWLGPAQLYVDTPERGFLKLLFESQEEKTAADAEEDNQRITIKTADGTEWVCPVLVVGEDRFYINLLKFFFSPWMLQEIGKMMCFPTALPGPLITHDGNKLVAAIAILAPVVASLTNLILSWIFSYYLHDVIGFVPVRMIFWAMLTFGTVLVYGFTRLVWYPLSEQNADFARDIVRGALMIPPQEAFASAILGRPIKVPSTEGIVCSSTQEAKNEIGRKVDEIFAAARRELEDLQKEYGPSERQKTDIIPVGPHTKFDSTTWEPTDETDDPLTAQPRKHYIYYKRFWAFVIFAILTACKIIFFDLKLMS